LEDNLKTLFEGVEQVDIEIEGRGDIRLVMKSEIHQVPSQVKVIVSMPIYEGRRFPIDIGKRITLFCMKKNVGVFSFSGLVVQRDIVDNIPRLHIQRVSPVRKTQRRDYFRLPIVMDAKIKIPDGIVKEKRIFKGKIEEVEEIQYKEIEVVTKDISGGGLRGVINDQVDIGTEVKTVLNLDNRTIEVDSTVVRCMVIPDSIIRYDLGIKFNEMDEKIRSRIITFIFERQRNHMKKGLV